MTKSYPFNVMDEKRKCVECPRPIKKRIAEAHPNKPRRCFRCHVDSERSRGHFMTPG